MIEQFVSDLQCENQVYAVIIRSPVSAGMLSSVQIPPLPEGYAFYGAGSIPAQKNIAVFDYELSLFADKEISYQGQAVGILTGQDQTVLETLQKEIRVDIEPVPEESFEEGRPHTLFDYPVIAKDIRTAGDIDPIFETAQSTVYTSFKIASQYSARSEPFSVITVFRQDGLDVYVPTQWPFHVRSAVAQAAGLEEQAVVVYPTRTGETFNELLWYPSLLACQCAVAAVLQRKTVVLNLQAEESRGAAPKTPEMIIEHKSVVSDKKSMTAMQISIIVNAGSCCPLIDKILKQMTAAALGPYRIPNYRIEARAAKTPQGLIDIFEGWGDYYVSNALENHISKIIQDYNFSPAQWRLQNISDDVSPVFSNLFESLEEKSNFARKYAAYHVFNSKRTDKHDGRWRGIGVAAGFQYSGCAAGFTYTVEMELNVHNQLSIKAEPAAEDVKKIIRTLAAEKLGIAEADISFAGITTADMNLCGPATAGITVSILMPLVEQCLADLQDQRFRNPLPLTILRSYCIPQPASPAKEGESSVAFISQTPVACIVELELDTVCYELIIRGIWFVCSPGKVYDKKRVLSYLRKNAVAALARTGREGRQYREAMPFRNNEQCSDSSGEDKAKVPYFCYQVMLPNELPSLSVEILERESPMSAFTSSVANVLPAAYLAALNQILLRVPVRIDNLPVLTEDIFKTLKR